MKMKTLCVHGNDSVYDNTGAVSVPIFQSATFVHPSVGESTGFDYSRLQNPTRQAVEETIVRLEGGIDAMAFSSGMAAVALLMELFMPGDHIIVSDDLYGGSHRYFSHISEKNGISVTAVNTSDVLGVKNSIKPNSKAIFIETPSNPMMQVTDISLIAEWAKLQGLLVIVDNTFLTPYFQQPLKLGADVVLHSGTKYLGGHNDTLSGFLVVKEAKLAERLRFLYKTVGSCLAPFDSWLLIRGMKTLALRLERQQENAMKIAKWLEEHGKIKKVYYIGLPTHPEYSISVKQASGFGAMISFEVDNEETALRMLHKIKVVQYAESLGGVESLMTYPMLQTHADVPREIREAKGINERLLRLSVGIEDIEDLLADLEQALSV